MKADELRSSIVYSAIGTISLMQLLALPALVGVLVDEAGMSESFAGWAASVFFAGAALVALVMALQMHTLHLRRASTLAIALLVVADLTSGYVSGWHGIFLAARLLAGVGAGVGHAAVLAAFARLEEAERGYGVFVTMQFAVSGVALYLLPVYSAQLGVGGMFLSFAALDLGALLLCRHLPGRAVIDAAMPHSRSELRVLASFVTIAALLGFFLYEMANTMQFTYVERLAVSLGFSDQAIGTALLVASLAGIPAAFAIVLIGDRFGRAVPLMFGIGASIVGLAILIFADTYPMYFVASVFLGAAWAFCLPFIQGLLAKLDPNGSALAAGSSLTTIGASVGPGVAALMVVGGRYNLVFATAIGLFVIAVVCFVATERRADPLAAGEQPA